MHSTKLNVLYIASIGRSGTTLLDCILGAHSEMASIGEIHLWPHELREGGVLPCGSGDFVHEDPFWSEMRDRVEPLSQPTPRIDYFREEHDAGRTLRPRYLSQFHATTLSDNTRSQIRQYAENNKSVYRAFLDLVESKEGTQRSWVVDSSKDPYRLLWLARSDMFNLSVIHLVRKPKGFIHSVTKPHIYTDENPVLRRLFWTIRQSGAWSIRNHLISKIAENHLPSDNYLLMRYEELASNPERETKSACDLVDQSYEQNAIDEFREGSPYALAGNPMRQREDDDIRLDETWKQNLPKSSGLITDLITTTNKNSFGYE